MKDIGTHRISVFVTVSSERVRIVDIVDTNYLTESVLCLKAPYKVPSRLVVYFIDFRSLVCKQYRY